MRGTYYLDTRPRLVSELLIGTLTGIGRDDERYNLSMWTDVGLRTNVGSQAAICREWRRTNVGSQAATYKGWRVTEDLE